MKNFIAYINGPTGIGKTTVSVALAKKYTKGVSIDIDVIKHFIKTGVLGEQLKTIDEIASTDIHGPHAEYYKMLANITCDIAERFYHNGYVVAISDMMWENWIIDIFKERLSQHNYAHFLFEMSKELLDERLTERTRQERILQKIASEKIEDPIAARKFTNNSITITDNELLERLELFTAAMNKVDKSKAIVVHIDALSIDEISQRIINHFDRP